MPHLRTVPAAAVGAHDPARENADAAPAVISLRPGRHQRLHHLESLTVDDGLVIVPNVVLRDLALVGLFLLCEEIDRLGLLKERVALVLLIREDAVDVAGVPMILPAWRGYPFFRQRGSYLERRLPKQKHPVDPLDQLRLFGVDHEVAVGPHVVVEEPFERNGHLAVSEPLSLTPGAVLRDRTAFFLGKRGHDGQQKLAFAVERPDVLFLEIDLNAMLLQLADGGEAVDRVAGETADRLCDDQVDLPGEGVGQPVSVYLLQEAARG